jgi:hypothetical protein
MFSSVQEDHEIVIIGEEQYHRMKVLINEIVSLAEVEIMKMNLIFYHLESSSLWQLLYSKSL